MHLCYSGLTSDMAISTEAQGRDLSPKVQEREVRDKDKTFQEGFSNSLGRLLSP